ncbi:MAG: right-handed parallel beta-helix repeat-containing protein [Clostridia bacterium]|nr:right-handed parallel beta-helix repeat-containing protein [Clostridia bacterium]
MKQTKKRLRSLLCVLLTCILAFSLCACPAAETPPDKPDEPSTPTPPTTPPEDENVIYNDPTILEGTGATLEENSPALNPRTYDETSASDIKALQFFRSCPKGEGKIYRVTDGNSVSITNAGGQVYECEGTVLLAPNGFIISECRDIQLTNLTIIGSLIIENSTNILLDGVEIIGTQVGLSADDTSSELTLKNCRISAQNACVIAGNGTTITCSYFSFTESGIDDKAKTGTTVYNCILSGSGTAIFSVSSEAAIRKNTIELGEKDIGITLKSGVLNTLVAQNVITGAQKAITADGVRNVSIILNSLISVEANKNKNLYICHNAMSGRLTANNNDYFLADGNTFPADKYSHTTVQSDNTNHNGDSLMDVNARLEVGADDALLPHVDKDLFVGMERKESVKDITMERALPIGKYIPTCAAAGDIVIIAPGAYTVDTTMILDAAHSNTTIYAYGVYFEQQNADTTLMNCRETMNIAFKGITFGFVRQSCGQVYILEKLTGNRIRVVTGAGMVNEFGNTNAAYFNTTGMGAQRAGTFYAYCDTSFISIAKDNSTDVPTMIMQLSPAVYNMMEAGDILTCRKTSGTSSHAIIVRNSGNISFKDVTLYGTASGMAFYENLNTTGVEYHRVANTTQNGVLIDQQTYELYEQLELTYGVDLEISKDDQGRFRGSPAHIGTVDATHVIACAQGSQATSCLFENMCDDATNQHAHHSRLADVRDMGDGKTMLVYKKNLSKRMVALNNGSKIPTSGTTPFKVGDRVYVYTAKGQLICDTAALSDTIDLKETEELSEMPGTTIALYGVIVPSDAVKTAPLAEFDLSDDSEQDTHKVLVDNMDMCCNYFKFDNCKIQNIRSRGLLIKASNGVIQNCTFRNIGMACAAILYELYYGESGVTENLLVDRNLFDHTGYFKNQELYATVSITGLGSEVQDDYLLYKDITISNNKMINRTTDYAIHVNSAKNVKILNNTFGPFIGNDFTNHPEDPEQAGEIKPLIHIFAAKDIEISGNTYPTPDASMVDYIVAKKNIHIYGTDVSMDGAPLIPDDQ